MKKYIFSLAFVFVLLLCTFENSMLVYGTGKTDEDRKIKVGYYPADGFQEVDENLIYSGYSYEYYMEIAQHSQWDYEFVTAPYAECMDMLRNGEIDVMSGINRYDEIEDEFDYSEKPIFTSTLILCTLGNNEELYYNDTKAFDGIKVGIISYDKDVSKLDDYCSKYGITIEKVFCNDKSELEELLYLEKVDAVYTSDSHFIKDSKTIATLGSINLYMAVKKGSELKAQIDIAISEISSLYFDFEYSLKRKYFNYNKNQYPNFTKEEMEYMKNNPVITVGYAPFSGPVSYEDEKTGECKGVVRDIFELMSKYTGIKFEYTTSDSFNSAINDFKEGNTDVFATVNREYYTADSLNAYVSYPYIKANMVAVTNRSKSKGSIKTIALPKDYYISEIIAKDNSEKNIIYCDSIIECLDKVVEGKADAAYMNTHVADYYLAHSKYYTLLASDFTKYTEELSIAVSKDMGRELLSIINKVLKCIDEDTCTELIVNNSYVEKEMSFKTLIYMYPMQTVIILMIMSVIMVIILAVIIRIKIVANKRISDIASKDSLTGIYNRGFMEETVRRTISEKGCGICAIISFDMDNFKHINDTYGHPEGDRLLCEVAECIKSFFGDMGITGRIGGDEYMIFVKEQSCDEEIMSMVTEIKAEIDNLLASREQWKEASISMGAAIYPKDGDDFETLYKKADKALYKSKTGGKNRISYVNN